MIKRLYAFFPPGHPLPMHITWEVIPEHIAKQGRVQVFVSEEEQKFLDGISATMDLVYPRASLAKPGDTVLFDNALIPMNSNQESDFSKKGISLGSFYEISHVRRDETKHVKIRLVGKGDVEFPTELFALINHGNKHSS